MLLAGFMKAVCPVASLLVWVGTGAAAKKIVLFIYFHEASSVLCLRTCAIECLFYWFSDLMFGKKFGWEGGGWLTAWSC